MAEVKNVLDHNVKLNQQIKVNNSDPKNEKKNPEISGREKKSSQRVQSVLPLFSQKAVQWRIDDIEE